MPNIDRLYREYVVWRDCATTSTTDTPDPLDFHTVSMADLVEEVTDGGWRGIVGLNGDELVQSGCITAEELMWREEEMKGLKEISNRYEEDLNC